MYYRHTEAHHSSTGLKLYYKKNKINCKPLNFSKSNRPVGNYPDITG